MLGFPSSFRLLVFAGLFPAFVAQAQAPTTGSPSVGAPGVGAPGVEAPGVLTLEDIRLLAIDAPKRAVVRLAGGDLETLEPGDEIAGTRARVLAIGVDKIVVETVTRDAEPARLQAWIYIGAKEGEPSRVLRLDPRSPAHPAEPRPMYLTPEGADTEPKDPELKKWLETLSDQLNEKQPAASSGGKG